jgi:DNA-binding response OmpR family regulator
MDEGWEGAMSNGFSRRKWGGGLDDLVVFVEDDEKCRESLAYLIKAARIPLETASDGLSASTLIRHRRPKVVVIDMYLPHRSGFEVVETLRADPILKEIFVIGLTGMAGDYDELDRVRLKCQADIVFPKPVNEETLIASIRGRIERRETRGLRRHLQA